MILLLDIDGVLQFGRPDFDEHMLTLGWKGIYAEFQGALFLDEEYRDTLIGKGDIRRVLQRMLKRFDQVVDVEVLMEQWTGINLTFNEELLDLLPRLETETTRLATNQDPVRGSSMRAIYAEHGGIDHVYLSHEIGFRKPFDGYFRHILDDIGCAPSDVIFVDDSPENVAGARSNGITAVQFDDNMRLIDQLCALGISAPG